jgi:UDP-N-acetylglucosamine 2-epimerase
VIHCGNSANEIESALLLALSKEFRQKLTDMDNPYEREGTSDKIVETICDALEQGIEIKKSFYDIV